MRFLKLIFSFLSQTIMWILVGIIIILAAPIFACVTIRGRMSLASQIGEIADVLDGNGRRQAEEERAQMDGDEILRRLSDGEL